VKLEADELRAIVRDTGIGIAPEQLASIFEMFHQADGTLERATGGLGVGLALTRRLVELHGGRVSARSAGLGRGSEFEVALPLAAPAPSDRYGAAPHGAAARRGQHILVVDDNRDFAQSLAGLLGAMGNDVRVVHDGLAGHAAALEAPPEVAILDIGMPKLNGFELARRLRDDPRTARCLLIAISGFSQPADRARARDAGFDHYFVKPVEIERLQEVLGR
jgi:CheY-like chemotaxis protein